MPLASTGAVVNVSPNWMWFASTTISGIDAAAEGSAAALAHAGEEVAVGDVQDGVTGGQAV